MSKLKELAGFMSRAEPYTYAALRIISGLMFSFHGQQKLFGWHADHQPPVGSQVWVGGIIELIGGLAVALGLCTRCAAFVTSGMMAVAYFQFHWRFAMDNGKWLPALNHGEMAALYCFVFLFIASRGSGKFALSSLIPSRSKS